MPRQVPAKLSYQSGSKTLRAEPQNWCVAQSASWPDLPDMYGAVDYPSTMRRIVAAYNNAAAVATQLEAWAEQASHDLRRCAVDDEDRYRNLRDNYLALAQQLRWSPE